LYDIAKFFKILFCKLLVLALGYSTPHYFCKLLKSLICFISSVCFIVGTAWKILLVTIDQPGVSCRDRRDRCRCIPYYKHTCIANQRRTKIQQSYDFMLYDKYIAATPDSYSCTLCPKKASPTFSTVTWKPITKFW